MRCGGIEAPRRKVGLGGLVVSWAQSRGEWPGERRIFLEGRGGRALVVWGVRRVDAWEGGERRELRWGGKGERVEEVGFGTVSVF